MTQQRATAHPEGVPAAGGAAPPPPGTAGRTPPVDLWGDGPVPILEATPYPEEGSREAQEIGQPATRPPRGQPKAKPDAGAKPAPRPRPEGPAGAKGAAKAGAAKDKSGHAKAGQAKAGQAKAGQAKAGKKGKPPRGKIDGVAALKVSAGIVVCVAMPPLAGEALKALFHLHMVDTLVLTLALYPVFVLLFIWLFVRALFKPVANADAKGAPLPEETSDQSGRDDGSTLM